MSPFHLEKLKEEMGKVGFIEAITARSGDENGPFDDGMWEIINGEHRWMAAKELGFTEVLVNDLGNVPTELAKMLCITLNELHGEPNQDNLAKLIAEMQKSGHEDLVNLLPYSEQELESYLTSGAADMDALERLSTDDGEESAEEEDEEESDLAEYLGIYSLTPDQQEALQQRIEEEIVPRLGNLKRAGQLLDRMISVIVENVEKKGKKAKAAKTEEEDADADED